MADRRVQPSPQAEQVVVLERTSSRNAPLTVQLQKFAAFDLSDDEDSALTVDTPAVHVEGRPDLEHGLGAHEAAALAEAISEAAATLSAVTA